MNQQYSQTPNKSTPISRSTVISDPKIAGFPKPVEPAGLQRFQFISSAFWSVFNSSMTLAIRAAEGNKLLTTRLMRFKLSVNLRLDSHD
jgi:hypothetical protein